MKLKIHNQKLNYENKYLTINSLKSFKDGNKSHL